SLSGAVRPVAQTAARLKEAQKLGFARAIVPEAARGEAATDAGVSLQPIGLLANLVADIAGRGQPSRPKLRSAGQQDGSRGGRARLYSPRAAQGVASVPLRRER